MPKLGDQLFDRMTSDQVDHHEVPLLDVSSILAIEGHAILIIDSLGVE